MNTAIAPEEPNVHEVLHTADLQASGHTKDVRGQPETRDVNAEIR